MIQFGLVFECKTKNQSHYYLTGYIDNNFAKDPKDRKSVIGYCFFFNRVIALWSSKKQQTISTLTTEAKYIALENVVREAI